MPFVSEKAACQQSKYKLGFRVCRHPVAKGDDSQHVIAWCSWHHPGTGRRQERQEMRQTNRKTWEVNFFCVSSLLPLCVRERDEKKMTTERRNRHYPQETLLSINV